MADCTKNKNPLMRSGTSRKERLLPGLDLNYILPEEHTFEDWLVYARNLAAYVKYYDSDPAGSSGNWQPFFDTDVSAQLALIAVQKVELYKDRIRSIFDLIKDDEYNTGSPADITLLEKNFGWLFSAVLSLAYRMDYFHTILPDDIPLKRGISNVILVRLAPALRRLLGYYKAARGYYQPKLVLETAPDDWSILAYKVETADDIVNLRMLSEKWIVPYPDDTVTATDWTTYYDTVVDEDHSIFNHDNVSVPDTEVWTVLNHVVNHNLFSGIFAEFLSGYARVVADAKKQLVTTITSQNTHQPHYALFLTFLHLTKYVREGLNTFSQRHLDFYYKDILRLQPRKSEPNHTHLVFELANMASDHLVSEGTSFKAGKDSAGKEVIYKTDDDIIVNKAKVAYLSSFYRAIATDKIGVSSLGGSLYASPVANSSDGLGAKLTTNEGEWHPFVNKVYADGELSAITMPAAKIGFAISSPNLFLKEGKRTIAISWTGAVTGFNNKTFECYLTTEKGWSAVKIVKISAGATSATAVINIAAGEPPVTAFDAKVHVDKDQHQQSFAGILFPMIKFILQDRHPVDQYEDLRNITITGVDIKVNVGTFAGQNNKDGIKELLIATDAGTADPSKPFLPFGINPKKGASMIIGNKEVFSKPNTRIKLFFEWAELTSTIQDMDWNLTDEFFPTAQVKFLENGVWRDGTFKSTLNKEHTNAAPGEVELFWAANSKMIVYAHLPSSEQAVPSDAICDMDDNYAPYNIASKKGFMKIELNADFQWDNYFVRLQKYFINVATGTADTEPIKPYLPKIQSLYMSYESVDKLRFAEGEESAFIHIYPFGTDTVDHSDLSSGSASLMPQFTHSCTDQGTKSPNQAEFYIGLQNAVPPQEINVLFKVLDGTTDPRQQKPKQHITWSYLGDNKWTDFDSDKVNDTTQQLLSTGIVSFPLPEEATSDNTVLPSGYHWIRASVSGLPEEACKLIDVKAQAVQATFFDQGNAADFLAQPLAAGSITKFAEPDPLIKKVEQPYASFGGRYEEDTRSYYTRVSERLRHKNRAITIRDIEQLVLERFEDIHKVKCLNHTKPLTTNSAGADAPCGVIILPENTNTAFSYNEVAAGHVTVLTIPDIRNRNAIDPLRPYTSKSRLQDIEDYLVERSNCNVNWHIINPQFEEIRVATTIILAPDAAADEAYYKDQLRTDLVKFLTPWAYNADTDIAFGGKVVKSAILNFIEELPYVDVILDLHMYHNNGAADLDEIIAASYSILVAAPAATHDIFVTQKPKKSLTSGCQ